MAEKFIPINDLDTKEFRKQLGFPITKSLYYFYKENGTWYNTLIIDFEISKVLQPSGAYILVITLESGKKVSILSDYLAEMQKPSFLTDIQSSDE